MSECSRSVSVRFYELSFGREDFILRAFANTKDSKRYATVISGLIFALNIVSLCETIIYKANRCFVTNYLVSTVTFPATHEVIGQ
jgi:hypothetical protein